MKWDEARQLLEYGKYVRFSDWEPGKHLRLYANGYIHVCAKDGRRFPPIDLHTKYFLLDCWSEYKQREYYDFNLAAERMADGFRMRCEDFETNHFTMDLDDYDPDYYIYLEGVDFSVKKRGPCTLFDLTYDLVVSKKWYLYEGDES